MPTNKAAARYRTLWRWHFYAGILCVPFILLLCVTGTIYLYKPQFEAWVDRDVNDLKDFLTRGKPSEVVRAAMASHPGEFLAFELSPTKRGADRVLIRQGNERYRVYVHPTTLQTLKVVSNEAQLMDVVKKIHGELMIGDLGSAIVELVACWTLVMVLTGVYLWWPRNAKGLGGIVYPRLFGSGKVFWRDIHSVAGVWISLGIILLIVTGLPWASFWGDYFRWGRSQLGLSSSTQSWSTRSNEHSQHNTATSIESIPTHDAKLSDSDLENLDRVYEVPAPLKLRHPVTIQPPTKAGGPWTKKSMAQNRRWRETLAVDGATGTIINREKFSDRHWLDRWVSTGIALHEGQLFGWLNQLLATLTTLGLMLLSVSGLVMWVRRRPSGKLGAPERYRAPIWSLGLIATVVVLGVAMPLFGLSVLVVLVLEQILALSAPGIASWLDLTTDNASG